MKCKWKKCENQKHRQGGTSKIISFIQGNSYSRTEKKSASSSIFGETTEKMVYWEHALTRMLVSFLIAVIKYLQRSIWRVKGIILTPGLWVQYTEAVKTWWSTWWWECVSKQTRKQREEHPSALLLPPSFSFLFSPWDRDRITHIQGMSSLTNILRSVSPKWDWEWILSITALK